MSEYVVIPGNVVVLEPAVLTRRETELLAGRVAELDRCLTEQILDELIEEDRDYREALGCIEKLVLELLAEPVEIEEKVAIIKNKLQPVLVCAGDTPPLEVYNEPQPYTAALEHILRVTRALYNSGDGEWVATGVKLIQSMLPSVLAHA